MGKHCSPILGTSRAVCLPRVSQHCFPALFSSRSNKRRRGKKNNRQEITCTAKANIVIFVFEIENKSLLVFFGAYAFDMAAPNRAWPDGALQPRRQNFGILDLEIEEDSAPEESALPSSAAKARPADLAREEAPAETTDEDNLAEQEEQPEHLMASGSGAKEDDEPAQPRARARRGQCTKKRPTCAGPACVFSTARAGQASRVQTAGQKCMWCDASALQTAQATARGQQCINRSLNAFDRLASPALAQALARLPVAFKHSSKYCAAPQCVFSHSNPGQPARTQPGAAHCIFCAQNAAGQLAAEEAEAGRQTLNRSLSFFAGKQTFATVLDKAWERLSEDFREGCSSFQARTAKQKADRERQKTERESRRAAEREKAKANLEAQQRKEQQRRLERERQARLAGWQDAGSSDRPRQPGDILRIQGKHYILKQPPWACGHQRQFGAHAIEDCPLNEGHMCPHHDWKCSRATTRKPSPPSCRICVEGFRPTDRQPEYTDQCPPFRHLQRDEERLEAYLADHDVWCTTQPEDRRSQAQEHRWQTVPSQLWPRSEVEKWHAANKRRWEEIQATVDRNREAFYERQAAAREAERSRVSSELFGDAAEQPSSPATPTSAADSSGRADKRAHADL